MTFWKGSELERNVELFFICKRLDSTRQMINVSVNSKRYNSLPWATPQLIFRNWSDVPPPEEIFWPNFPPPGKFGWSNPPRLGKFPNLYYLTILTLLPKGGGGGGLFGLRHQTGSQNSRTLSPRLVKISDFSFMLFGHIVAKFQVN